MKQLPAAIAISLLLAVTTTLCVRAEETGAEEIISEAQSPENEENSEESDLIEGFEEETGLFEESSEMIVQDDHSEETPEYKPEEEKQAGETEQNTSGAPAPSVINEENEVIAEEDGENLPENTETTAEQSDEELEAASEDDPEPGTFTVTLDANGGAFTYGPSRARGPFSAVIQRGQPIGNAFEEHLDYPLYRNGHQFTGWYLDKACTQKLSGNIAAYVPESDITLYAGWKETGACVTVTYYAGEGHFADGSKILSERQGKGYDGILAPAVYGENENYLFGGWFTDPAFKHPVDLTDYYDLQSDTSFYAMWSGPCTVTLDGNGGLLLVGPDYYEQTKQFEVVKGSASLYGNFASGIREGYVLYGWSLEKGEKGVVRVLSSEEFRKIRVYEDMTIYAVWAKAKTVILDANGGTITCQDENHSEFPITVDEDGYLEIHGYTLSIWKKDSVLIGWGFEPDGEAVINKEQLDSQYYCGDGTRLYAIWGEPLSLYLHAGEGYFTNRVPGDWPRDEYCRIAKEALPYEQPPVPERNDGLSFAGWSLLPDGEALVDLSTHIFTEEEIVLDEDGHLNLYAVWGGSPVTHTWEKTRIIKDPSCRESGLTEYTCTKCGDKKIEVISPKPHTWESTIVKEATSLETGVRRYTCTVCGKTRNESIPVTFGWKKNKTGWWYEREDGSYPKSGWAAIGGKWYYFNSSGYMQTGWQQIGGTWYLLNQPSAEYEENKGAMATGWQNVGGKWYYFNGSGAMQTGWQSIGGKWYYLNSSGVMMTGWQQISGKWYYMNSGGAMVTGWQSIGGKWYYFNSGGEMMTGWQQIGGKWYYMNSGGAMVTGWQSIGGKWYYFSDSGAMVTGWQSIGGKWYYFSSSGAMASNTWIGDYYLTESGAMATDTWIGNYYVGPDGKWIKDYGTGAAQ